MAEGADEDSSSAGLSSGLIVAHVPEGQGKLVCVEYPGFVDNVDRALTSLGGIKTISQVHYEKNHALEVRLRPEDRRHKKSESGRREEGTGQKNGARGPECQVEVLGLVKVNFEFTGMVDYQALPPGLSRVSHNAETVDPSLFQITEPFDDTFQTSKVPLFLPPRVFSKFDKPSNYANRPDFQPKITENQQPGKSRQKRQVHAYNIPFNHKEPIPSQPHPSAPHSNHPKLPAIRELFMERPIWSRSGIQSRIKIPSGVARSLLALVSYNFTSGPWKTLWVKLGYDPRSTTASKVYQCIDYRMPKDITMIETRRSRQKFKAAPPPEKKRIFQLTGDEDSVRLAEEVWAEGHSTEPECNPVFTPDRLPSQRQMYYQLCDLKDDTLQAIIHANDGKEKECTEANGWCEEGAYDLLRKTLGEMIRKTAERIKGELTEQSGVTTSTSQSTDPQ